MVQVKLRLLQNAELAALDAPRQAATDLERAWRHASKALSPFLRHLSGDTPEVMDAEAAARWAAHLRTTIEAERASVAKSRRIIEEHYEDRKNGLSVPGAVPTRGETYRPARHGGVEVVWALQTLKRSETLGLDEYPEGEHLEAWLLDKLMFIQTVDLEQRRCLHRIFLRAIPSATKERRRLRRERLLADQQAALQCLNDALQDQSLALLQRYQTRCVNEQTRLLKQLRELPLDERSTDILDAEAGTISRLIAADEGGNDVAKIAGLFDSPPQETHDD